MERTLESNTSPVTEASLEQLHVQMNKELQQTCFFLIKHDRHREKVAVANRLAPHVEYDPEDIAGMHMAPICKRQRWWLIPGTQRYGMTDDARLTVSDPNGLPYLIMLTNYELTRADIIEVISGLQQMRKI